MKPLSMDVSELGENPLDHRSLVWWGNTLLLVIETTMFALLVASYFYVRMNYSEWPPPFVDGVRTIRHPMPPLLRPTLTLAVLLLSVVPAFIADRAALAMNQARLRWSLFALVAGGIVAAALRFHEFPALQFSWGDNAYASVIWTIACVHLLHIIISTAETTAMCIWAFSNPLDRKHARDSRTSAAYWYWVAGLWVPLYCLIYLGPRFS
jgi:heme/copper-type cytochrome/quinol oxidase subunit 3